MQVFQPLQHCMPKLLGEARLGGEIEEPVQRGLIPQMRQDGNTCGDITTEAPRVIQRFPDGRVGRTGWEEEKRKDNVKNTMLDNVELPVAHVKWKKKIMR